MDLKLVLGDNKQSLLNLQPGVDSGFGREGCEISHLHYSGGYIPAPSLLPDIPTMQMGQTAAGASGDFLSIPKQVRIPLTTTLPFCNIFPPLPHLSLLLSPQCR